MLIWCNWVQLYIFEYIQGHLSSKGYDLSDLRVQIQIWLVEDLVLVIWGCIYTLSLKRDNFNDLRVQRHIWVVEGLILMIWGCKCTLPLKRVWFEWFEGAITHHIWRGYDLSSLKVQRCIFESKKVYFRSGGSKLGGLSKSRKITTCNRLDLEILGFWLTMPKNLPRTLVNNPRLLFLKGIPTFNLEHPWGFVCFKVLWYEVRVV